MKRIIISTLFLIASLGTITAQKTSDAKSKSAQEKVDKEAKKAKEKADKDAAKLKKKADKDAEKAKGKAEKAAQKAKEKADNEASKVTKSTGINKDGTPDKRMKKNKGTTTSNTTTTTTPPIVAPKAPSAPSQGVNKSADKSVGTDAKGRTIYEGPRGGRYTLTKNGNKEYIKRDK